MSPGNINKASIGEPPPKYLTDLKKINKKEVKGLNTIPNEVTESEANPTDGYTYTSIALDVMEKSSTTTKKIVNGQVEETTSDWQKHAKMAIEKEKKNGGVTENNSLIDRNWKKIWDKTNPTDIQKIGGQEIRVDPKGSLLAIRSDLDIDTDGSGNHHGDKWAQDQTSMAYSDGSFVDANKTPYIVLPPDISKQYGVELGDMAAVRYKGKMMPAIFVDWGPKKKIGEGSYRLALGLEVDPDPNIGGTMKDVEMIVFPGSGSNQNWTPENTTKEALMPKVQKLLKKRAIN